jgi:hypothetical protein
VQNQVKQRISTQNAVLCTLCGATLFGMGGNTKIAVCSLISHGLIFACVFKRRFSRMPFLPGNLTPAYPQPWHARSFGTNCPEADSGAASPTGISHSDGHVLFKLRSLATSTF